MKKPKPKPVINQLEFVRERLSTTPTDDMMGVATDSKLNIRTLYNVLDPKRNPTYETVYRIYSALHGIPTAEKHALQPRRKVAPKQPAVVRGK